jgi:hypothetical protein
MNEIILDIIKSFESNTKKINFKYTDFIAHVYKTFDNKINSCKVEKIKNKYKKIRLSILKYIIENEKEITYKIHKCK